MQLLVKKAMLGCWVRTTIQTIWTFTISETTYRKAGLRCVLEVCMALFVMTSGTTKMPQWCADNLDSLFTVHSGRMHGIVLVRLLRIAVVL